MQDPEKAPYSEEQVAQVAQVFINLGATENTAPTMAEQLLKRADQIARERGIPYVEAAEKLLKQVVEARTQA